MMWTELRPVAVGERLLDAVDVDAVGLEGDADPVDAELLEHQQRPVVGGLFDDHLDRRAATQVLNSIEPASSEPLVTIT